MVFSINKHDDFIEQEYLVMYCWKVMLECLISCIVVPDKTIKLHCNKNSNTNIYIYNKYYAWLNIAKCNCDGGM